MHRKSPESPSGLFLTTIPSSCVIVAPFVTWTEEEARNVFEEKVLEEVNDIKNFRWDNYNLVFFPMCAGKLYYVVCFDFMSYTVKILDNIEDESDVGRRYCNVIGKLTKNFITVLEKGRKRSPIGRLLPLLKQPMVAPYWIQVLIKEHQQQATEQGFRVVVNHLYVGLDSRARLTDIVGNRQQEKQLLENTNFPNCYCLSCLLALPLVLPSPGSTHSWFLSDSRSPCPPLLEYGSGRSYPRSGNTSKLLYVVPALQLVGQSIAYGDLELRNTKSEE
ncbi:hypothetical protein AAHA92_09828 [Salvia divinorum]|uniref:Uncharacterized protein n=1 Tax=Salvia divinorum TaxID=28513 RepID=A0ABD1HSP3_SALDI